MPRHACEMHAQCTYSLLWLWCIGIALEWAQQLTGLQVGNMHARVRSILPNDVRHGSCTDCGRR
jgi:hypothetical protein